MQDVDGDVGCIDVDEIESTATLPQGDQSVLASGLDDAQLGDLGAFGDVGVESLLQGGELVAIGRLVLALVALVLHAAFKGVDGGHEGVGMAHEVVKDPGGGTAFETANLEDAKLAIAEMCGPFLPFVSDQLEPVLLEGEPAAVVVGCHFDWMCGVGQFDLASASHAKPALHYVLCTPYWPK